MKECAADLSKVYGVTMVDGIPDGGRLQMVGATDRAREGGMSEESPQGDKNTPGSASARGLSGFAAGVLFGAVLGAGLALLLAPQRRDSTRRRLRKRLARLRERAEEGLDRAGKRSRRELARRRRRMAEALERVRERGGWE